MLRSVLMCVVVGLFVAASAWADESGASGTDTQANTPTQQPSGTGQDQTQAQQAGAQNLGRDYQEAAGTWQLVASVGDGKPMAADQVQRTQLVLQGNTFRFPQGTPGDMGPAGTYVVHANTNPKQVDTTANEGPDKGKTSLGIYQISGDSHISCFAKPGDPRPTDFTAPSGSGRTLQVWQRIR